MDTITVVYDLKWQHKKYTWYKWTICGKLYNTKTNRKIKKTVNGRSIGYWINGKFKPLSILKNEIIRIPKESTLPF